MGKTNETAIKCPQNSAKTKTSQNKNIAKQNSHKFPQISLHCLKENVETLDWNQSLNNHLDNITAMWNKYDMNNYDPSAQWG